LFHYKYLIVGGGMAADAAVDGIRNVDSDGSIGLLGAEHDPPYDRPPLSKKLWKGEPTETIWRGTEAKGVDMRLGRSVRRLALETKQVIDDSGEAYSFDRLLLATGGTPRKLSFGGEDIIYYRTVQDYRHLRDLSTRGQRFAVIGGGFIGSEIAAALAMNGKQVILVFPEEAVGARVYPRELATFLNGYYRDRGVEIVTGATVEGMERQGPRLVLQTSVGTALVVDGVIAGLGITPNVELAREAGLHVENGIIVDETLRTSHPDVYAAGDVAEFYNPALGQGLRVEHEDNANVMGRSAGLAMAGRPEPYTHLPFFYSDLFDLGYEAVGLLDSRLETVADWKEPNQEGVVYYLRDGRVRGVLLWNVWEQVDASRRLIAEPGPFEANDLSGRLPEQQSVGQKAA
jgi:3-phenylpropionate/trans-cinnamate dioxygenase ferredoxin reductase component